MTLADTILDEAGQPLQKAEERLGHWKRHFEGVLKVQSTIAEDMILFERLQAIIGTQLMDTRCGFGQGRNTANKIRVTCQVVENVGEYQTPVYLCFVDLSKAYDSVYHTAMVAILKSYGVPHQVTSR